MVIRPDDAGLGRLEPLLGRLGKRRASWRAQGAPVESP